MLRLTRDRVLEIKTATSFKGMLEKGKVRQISMNYCKQKPALLEV